MPAKKDCEMLGRRRVQIVPKVIGRHNQTAAVGGGDHRLADR
jgi:hypothetical protein